MKNRSFSLGTPASEPVTLSEAKNHLKVDTSADDSLITALITAARQWTEFYLGRVLVTTTVTEKADCLPEGDTPAELRFCPVASVTSVKYINADGTETTWSSSEYLTDFVSAPCRLAPKPGFFYPSPDTRINAVEIVYVAGYANAATVPAAIRQGILLMVGEMYENRENTVKKMPTAVEYLLQPYRVWKF